MINIFLGIVSNNYHNNYYLNINILNRTFLSFSLEIDYKLTILYSIILYIIVLYNIVLN